jgi:membrane fusion protein, multidrug efflux system
MKFAPVFTAVLVSVFLYFLVIERDRLLEFAGITSTDESGSAMAAPQAEAGTPLIKVFVTRSEASILDNAVILRGETEAARQVDVRAETSGLVISEPLRKGVSVAEGELLCELDAGTRRAALDEAKARLAEAISLPKPRSMKTLRPSFPKVALPPTAVLPTPKRRWNLRAPASPRRRPP